MTNVIGVRNVGASVKRAEDPRILTGRGQYVDDVKMPGMLHAAFLRSTMPHAKLVSVDVSEARELPGVVAVYTGADLAAKSRPGQAGALLGMNMMPGMKSPHIEPLATTKVRHIGDPIALVVAENRYIAEDALELIVEDYEPLDPVVTYEQALDPSRPPIFEEFDDNIALSMDMAIGDLDAVFAKADRVISTSISVHRHAPMPMEGRGSIASWDPETEHLTIYESTQSPHATRMLLPMRIDLPIEKIRVHAGDVGGAFGLKTGLFREDVALVLATMDIGRPVKWIEDRAEHLATGGHAREEMADIEIAVTNDGELLGFRMDAKLNSGAYPHDPFPGAMFIGSLSGSFQGPANKLEAIAAHSTSVFSNKAPYVSYRGPWATGDFLRERVLDIVAHELGIDRVEIRRRNYAVLGEEPTRMLTGPPYAGITTRECLDQGAALIDWEGFPARQEAARREGRYLGIGVASYLEAAPGPKNPDGSPRGGGVLGNEVTHIRVLPDGKIEIITQQMPHGQSHETTLAQVAADELGVAYEDIVVRYGDTDFAPPTLVATGGSRAATMANGAVMHASRDLRQKILSIAAELMEANPDDLEIAGGTISVKGSPVVSLPLAELSRIVAEEPDRLPAGTDTDLKATNEYDGGEGGWSGGTHLCIVEVDVETGLVEIERYVVMEDCGLPVNPAVVEGQIRGGVAQAIGAVLLEHAAYADDGTFLAGTFMDYLMPTTTIVPNFEIHHVDAVMLDPDVNFKGVGEGGMIVAPACLTGAIENALSPFGVVVTEQYLPPARILELIGTVPVES